VRRAATSSLRTVTLAAALVVGLSTAGCDEPLATLAGPTPDLKPTFASVQAQIFESTDNAGRRACTTCHTNVGRSPAAGLNLTHDFAYASLVNAVSTRKSGATLVVPGDADASYIVHKIEGTSDTGARMPLGGPYLTDGQIVILKRWIAEGAARN
jgi:hypothetical protein